MVSDYRGIPQQVSPHIPQSPGYFTEQPRLAGYMGSELERTQRQQFQGDHHRQSPHPHSHPYPHPYLHPHPFLLPHSHDMHEAIQREIEKERIREEIIMSEIMRRRVLEAEVRRELMMERDIALRRGNNGFPFGSPLLMGFDSTIRLPLMETRAEGRSLEERTMFSLTDRYRLNVMRESGGSEPLPFQRGSADVRISEVKPVSECANAKEKEKIILLAKPKENLSGVKREVSGVDASETPSDGNLRKKAKEEWSCALCQVSATSERGLNEHLQGKKHKSKEATLKAQKAGKNYSIGLLPKKAAKAIHVPGTVDLGTDNEVRCTSESLPLDKTGEAGSKTDDLRLLEENLNEDNSKKNEVAQKVLKSNNPKKKNCRFWCELCQVGAHSQRLLNNHLKGKKHKRRQHMSNKIGGVGPSDEKDGAVDELVDATAAEDGGAVDEPVDQNLGEDGLVNDETLAEGELVNETLADDGGAENVPVEETITKDAGSVDEHVDETVAEDEPKDDEVPLY